MNSSRRSFVHIALSAAVVASLRTSLNAQVETSRVIVRVTEVRNSMGKVVIGLWKSKDGFPKDSSKAFRSVAVEIPGGAATTTFADLPYGDYAVAVYHDENNDGKMDTRFPGIPVEGIGSSNNPHPRFGPPAFSECRFNVGRPETIIAIKMLYL